MEGYFIMMIKNNVYKIILTVMLFMTILTIGIAGNFQAVMAEAESGDNIGFSFSLHPPTDDNFVIIPVSYMYTFNVTDNYTGNLEDYITVDNEEIVSYSGSTIQGLKEGETVLHYHNGTKQKDLTIKVVPVLDLRAGNIQAEGMGNKIKYSATIANHSVEDVIIEGFNLGGSVAGTSFAVLPWVHQKLELKAGETKDVSFFSEKHKELDDYPADKDIAKSGAEPPTVYVEYEGIHLLLSGNSSFHDLDSGELPEWTLFTSVSYYGNMTLEQCIKYREGYGEENDDDNGGQNTNPVKASKKLYALLVGGAKDARSGDSRNDVSLFEKNLLKYAPSGYKVNKKNIQKALFNNNMTRSGLDKKIRTAFKNATSRDICYIYYQGHGSWKEGTKKGGIFLDEKPYYYPYQELMETISKAVKGKVVVILDCCHAGGYVDAAKKCSAKKRMTVLAACETDETEGDTPDEVTGIYVVDATIAAIKKEALTRDGLYANFTFALSKGLRKRTADKNKDELYTANEIYSYTKQANSKKGQTVKMYAADKNQVLFSYSG